MDLCRNLRQSLLPKDVPILVVSEQTDLETIRSAYQAGATDFVTKPIHPDLLGHRVEYLLRSARALSDLRTIQNRLALAQRVAQLGYWEWDMKANRLYMSETCQRILEMDNPDPEGALHQFLGMVHPEDRRKVRRALLASIERKQDFHMNHRVLLAKGAEKYLGHEACVQLGEDGEPARVMGLVQDTTERWKAEARVRQLAYYDSVTGLPNRAYVLENLAQLLDPFLALGAQPVLLCIGLDHFRRINNTLGFQAGNRVLQIVAERLKTASATLGHAHPQAIEEDGVAVPMIARLGGDEFLLVFTHTGSLEAAKQTSKDLARILAEPVMIEGREISLTSSMGLGLYPQDGNDPESALGNTSAAMNLAKKRGRNMCQVFEREWSQKAQFYLTIESELRHAIEQDQFILHYQPKVHLGRNRVQGMEALVRWVHPKLGTISPVDFIPIAEQCGLIVPLGTWVLRTALEQMAAWNAEGLGDLCVSVNVSGAQLQQPGLDSLVMELLESTGVPAHQLELELTEGLLMEDTDRSIALLSRLTQQGVEISVDDFGTGYSSLSYLAKFPLSTIKVDRSFVKGITTNRGNAAIVSATIALAHSLRLQVVAEGVEEQPELDFLRGLRCDTIQGYYYSKPLPASEFASFVRHFDGHSRLRAA